MIFLRNHLYSPFFIDVPIIFGMQHGAAHCSMARWLSWLERRPVTAEVVGSSPIRVVFLTLDWDLSSAGRALALQARGHRFESCRSHFCIGKQVIRISRCGSTAEQLICNQQVIGSNPIVGFLFFIMLLIRKFWTFSSVG